MSKGLRNTILGVTGAGILAFEGGGMVYDLAKNNEPINAQTLKVDAEHPYNIGRSFLTEIVPSTYDNNADQQTVKVGTNTIFVSEDQLPDLMKDSIKPVIKGQFPDVSTLFLAKVTGQQDIEVSTYRSQGVNWITNEGGVMERGKTLKIPEIGTQIIIPVEGAEVFKFHDFQDGADPSRLDSDGIVIKFMGPDQTPYELFCYSTNPRDIAYLPTLDNAPFTGADSGYGGYFIGSSLFSDAKGKPLPIGTSIFKTNKKDAQIYFMLVTLADKVSNLNIASGGVVPSGFEFKTLTGNDGNQKVAVLPPSLNQP